jgi:hypothetical protein
MAPPVLRGFDAELQRRRAGPVEAEADPQELVESLDAEQIEIYLSVRCNLVYAVQRLAPMSVFGRVVDRCHA